MQRTYRMITSLVILGNNYQECDDLNDHVSQTLKMARKYDVKIDYYEKLSEKMNSEDNQSKEGKN